MLFSACTATINTIIRYSSSLNTMKHPRKSLLLGVGGFLRLFNSSASAAASIVSQQQPLTTNAAVPNSSIVVSSPRILLPRDVYFDLETRDHLQLLRENYGQNNGSPEAKALASRILKSFSSAGNTDRCTLTLKGFKGGRLEDQINQDRALIVNPLFPRNDQQEHCSPCMLLGVLDGHGEPGQHVSEFGRIELEKRLTALLQKELVSNQRKTSTITSSFSSSSSSSSSLLKNTTYISKLVTQLIEQINRDLPKPYGTHGGATVSLVLQLQDHIYLISAGDSQSFLAATVAVPSSSSAAAAQEANGSSSGRSMMETTTVVLAESQLHKPGRPEERIRIEAAGGLIEQEQPGESEDQARVSYFIGTLGYSLAMSRCLGDHPATGVIATPSIQVYTMKELLEQAKDKLQTMIQISNEKKQEQASSSAAKPYQTFVTSDTNINGGKCEAPPAIDPKDINLFAFSATDGLNDFVTPHLIADEMGRALYFGAKPAATHTAVDGVNHPLTAAEQLIMLSANRWHKEMNGQYRDDIAIAAATLHRPKR